MGQSLQIQGDLDENKKNTAKRNMSSRTDTGQFLTCRSSANFVGTGQKSLEFSKICQTDIFMLGQQFLATIKGVTALFV